MTRGSENSAMQVANSILQRSFDGKQPISHLKLQKLLYILHGWHLAIQGTPAFYDLVEAWNYGPVVASVYHTFKNHKDRFIETLGGDKTCVAEDKFPEFKKVADKVWDRYNKRDSFELVYLTHEGGTPWDITRNELKKEVIDNEIIEEYYKELLETLGLDTA